ncbi:MAG: FAD-dependent oxidoreductase [Pseudomonadota bacterium]
MGFDVAIVGAGVIGASAAFHLAERGFRVALISDGKPGASAAAAGMLSPSFEIGHDAADPAYAAMMQEGLSVWGAFAERLSSDPYKDFGYHRRGVYGIGYHAVPQGAEPVTTSPLGSFARQPSAFSPHEGCVEPLDFIRHLMKAAEEHGADIQTGTAELSGDELSVGGTKVDAEHIVLAAGAGAQGAAKGMQAVRGAAFVVQLPGGAKAHVPTVVRSPTVYFAPRRDGRLYIGATEEWPGAIAGTADELWRDAVRLLPVLHDADDVHEVSGLRPFLRRGGPLIQRDRERFRLVRAQGHHRNGVLLAPLTANRLEQIILGHG